MIIPEDKAKIIPIMITTITVLNSLLPFVYYLFSQIMFVGSVASFTATEEPKKIKSYLCSNSSILCKPSSDSKLIKAETGVINS